MHHFRGQGRLPSCLSTFTQEEIGEKTLQHPKRLLSPDTVFLKCNEDTPPVPRWMGAAESQKAAAAIKF